MALVILNYGISGQMKHEFSEDNILSSELVSVPDKIHFVWIGDIHQANAIYINIWKEVNKDKEIFLWCDINTSLVKIFHEAISNHVKDKKYRDRFFSEMQIKNDAFNYMYPKLIQGIAFDQLVYDFLFQKGIVIPNKNSDTVNPHYGINGVKIRELTQLFSGEFTIFMRFYYYEIILRGNYASASDIVRLLVIYSEGGVYVDNDTLPNTDAIFENLNNTLNELNIINNDLICLFKTECILEKLGFASVGNIECYLKKTHKDEVIIDKIKTIAEQDMLDFSLCKISPLGELKVHKNFLAIGSLRRLRGVYFNHFMSSHPRSKAIKIILRTMNKRYRYIECNNCIFDTHKEGEQLNYLSRLLTWRTELQSRNYSVTTALTGPRLIVEVLLGLVYAVFYLDESISPSFIAEYMQNEKFNFALYKHNLDTPNGIYSSWRK